MYLISVLKLLKLKHNPFYFEMKDTTLITLLTNIYMLLACYLLDWTDLVRNLFYFIPTMHS